MKKIVKYTMLAFLAILIISIPWFATIMITAWIVFNVGSILLQVILVSMTIALLVGLWVACGLLVIEYFGD